ncbi:MAG TPA: hypothetical protein VGK67_37805 [Myxococcales bacterium]|jgi:hypothetical protein
MTCARPLALLLALCAPLLAAPLSGCATASTVPDADRHSLARAWDGKLVYLRSSVNVLPLFADGSRRLVSPLHPDSILLLADGRGAPVPPGPVESVVPMGSRVRIQKLEFPTGLVVTRRPPGTPREHPWVYLSFPGAAKDLGYVAVLRTAMTTREDVLAALGDLFSDEDPSLWLKSVSPEARRAIEEKRLLSGMDGEQVMASWGRPERTRQDSEAAADADADNPLRVARYIRVETWTWPVGLRTATFRDGRLTASTPPLEQDAR